MTITSQETDVEIQQFPIVLGERGEITIPQLLQDSLNVNEGDMLVLLQIGNLIVLAPKQPQAPQLIDQIATIMENENVELSDLLAGLEAEREAMNICRLQCVNCRIVKLWVALLFILKLRFLCKYFKDISLQNISKRKDRAHQ